MGSALLILHVGVSKPSLYIESKSRS